MSKNHFLRHFSALLALVGLTAGYLSAQKSSLPNHPGVGGSIFSGIYTEGEGDVKLLDALNAAFESMRPSPNMANLPLLYKRDWNGYVEGPVWPCWWIQNTFGATYSMMPFLGEEPYAQRSINLQRKPG